MSLEFTGERLTRSLNNKTMVEHVHRYGFALSFVEGKIVLDIACGEGYGSNLLSKKARFVYGVDISPETIIHARQAYTSKNINFQVGSTSKIPLETKSVDVVISFETIEHHDEHELMIREIKRVLKPDGIFIISSPDKLYYSDIPHFSNKFHIKELYKDEFSALIRNHFENIQVFSQGIIRGSIIYNEDFFSFGREFLKGDFDQISKMKDISNPEFNIIIASDVHLLSAPFSFFESNAINAELLGQLNYIKGKYFNSFSYKVSTAFRKASIKIKQAISLFDIKT